MTHSPSFRSHFNFYDVLYYAGKDEGKILLGVYAFMNPGAQVGWTLESPYKLLGLPIPPEPVYHMAEFFDLRYNEYSGKTAVRVKHLKSEPYNFVNPLVLTAKVPLDAKLSYIRLSMLISNAQRWEYKLWGKPITISKELEIKINENIPKDWYETTTTHIRLLKEEQNYGR